MIQLEKVEGDRITSYNVCYTKLLRFIIEEGVEDVHSQVEFLLTQELGDLGKKIHSGRSRVITSYSIHYTKLYEGLGCGAKRRMASGAVIAARASYNFV